MLTETLLASLCVIIAIFTFDISFNLRRLTNNTDRIWRKLAEMESTLAKK